MSPDPYCRYCGLPATSEAPKGCPRHPRPQTELERLEQRVTALESILKNARFQTLDREVDALNDAWERLKPEFEEFIENQRPDLLLDFRELSHHVDEAYSLINWARM